MLACCAAAHAAAPAVSAIRAGRLVDVTNGQRRHRPGHPGARRWRIEAVGAADSVTVPAGAKIIDLTSYTVLPGLIDTHTHITSDPTLPPLCRLRFVRAANRAERR